MRPALKIKTILALAAAISAPLAPSFAETNEDYIKTFGMVVFKNSGLPALKLAPAEFDLFLQGFKDAYAGRELPKNINESGEEMMKYLRTRAEKNGGCGGCCGHAH